MVRDYQSGKLLATNLFPTCSSINLVIAKRLKQICYSPDQLLN